jgi:hypothetical protein
MKYPSPEQFRQELESVILRAAEDQRQVQELRLEVAFERALARFDYDQWSLKGGYALRLMLPESRHTNDLDLVLNGESMKELQPQERARKVQEYVNEQLSKNLQDHFKFKVVTALPITDMEPDNLAAIVLITAEIGSMEFCKIRIDVGVSDREDLPHEQFVGHDLLRFADVSNPIVATKAREEIFSEKLLAYSGQGADGTRWRDLVDMQLLIDLGMNQGTLISAMQQIEEREHKRYHEQIGHPPRHWAKEYAETAGMCKLPVSLEQAYEQLNEYVGPLLDYFRKSL